MQHTEVLELNACLAYLRTGKEVPKSELPHLYDMTWTFTAPRDPAITELFSSSPGDSVWLPTAADIKAEQQRRQKEREDESRRAATPQPAQKPVANLKELTPVPLSGLRAPLEFRKKPVANKSAGRSMLTAELNHAKKGGGVVGTAANAPLPANVPSFKLTIYLPSRQGVEIRVAKTATVEQAIAAILERCRDKLGRKKPERFEMRMHDSDGLPDDDFPALDRASVISEMGSNEFCLCDLKSGDSEDDEEEAAPVAAAVAPQPSIPTSNTPNPLLKSKSITKPNSVKIVFMDNTHDQQSSVMEIDPEDARAASCLRKIVKKYRLPLFSEEYQLQVRDEDREKLGMLTPILQPQDDVLNIGTDTILVCKRRFADAPPDADQVDALKTTAGREARRVSEIKKTEQAGAAGAAVGAGPAGRKDQTGAPAGGEKVNPLEKITVVTINDQSTKKEDGLSTPGNSSRGAVKSSATKSIRKGARGVPNAGVDPEKILLNEIKAALYEEWKVIKTNNWGKNQNRILGIDLQKIYNKPRSEGGFHQSVKHAERLIADVVSIDLNPNNPAAFTIKVRDGPGNSVVVLNYEAEEGADDAAKIVAKVKYIQGGLMPSRN